MTDWTAFAGFAGVVLALLLVLARASQSQFAASADAASSTVDVPPLEAHAAAEALPGEATARLGGTDAPDALTPAERHAAERSMSFSTPALLVNVALSQGLFALFLLVAVWLTEVPPAALGATASSASPSLLGVGVALGVGLYALNEVGSVVGDRLGVGSDEALRDALTPETGLGWIALLGLVLPVIAGFEELLFRGVLVGALAVGFGVSPWLLAVLSSLAFALGHGAQGPGGVVVTGLLGFALAAAFVTTGSLAVVFVAHYLVNALAFVVHGWFGWDPFGVEG